MFSASFVRTYRAILRISFSSHFGGSDHLYIRDFGNLLRKATKGVLTAPYVATGQGVKEIERFNRCLLIGVRTISEQEWRQQCLIKDRDARAASL